MPERMKVKLRKAQLMMDDARCMLHDSGSDQVSVRTNHNHVDGSPVSIDVYQPRLALMELNVALPIVRFCPLLPLFLPFQKFNGVLVEIEGA